jgi:hypothetical protein
MAGLVLDKPGHDNEDSGSQETAYPASRIRS